VQELAGKEAVSSVLNQSIARCGHQQNNLMPIDKCQWAAFSTPPLFARDEYPSSGAVSVAAGVLVRTPSRMVQAYQEAGAGPAAPPVSVAAPPPRHAQVCRRQERKQVCCLLLCTSVFACVYTSELYAYFCTCKCVCLCSHSWFRCLLLQHDL